MIRIVHHFHISAVFVACIFLYELKKKYTKLIFTFSTLTTLTLTSSNNTCTHSNSHQNSHIGRLIVMRIVSQAHCKTMWNTTEYQVFSTYFL